MCQEKNNIIFCTCSEKKIGASESLNDYSWSLSKYLGRKETSLRGKIVIPKKDLGNGITVENILMLLNSNVKSFDFDYEPTERDSLRIEIPHPTERMRYFRVKYFNGEWTEGGNNIFTSITENIAEGKIKKRTHNNGNRCTSP